MPFMIFLVKMRSIVVVSRKWGLLSAMFWLAASALPQSPVADLLKNGDEDLKKGDYAHAIESYTNAIKLDPRSAKALYSRGFAYYRNQEYDRAIQDYTDAIRLEPSFTQVFRERGHAYEDKGDYEHAIEDYSHIIPLQPGDVVPLYERAFDYERAGEYDRAIADFTEILRRFPQAPDAYRDRGQARLLSGHLPEALQDLSRSVELTPTSPYNVLWLYIARARTGKGAEYELGRNAEKVNLAKWPGVVIQMFLGKTPRETVLRVAADKDLRKQDQQECEAHFYIAEYDALHGRTAAAQDGFRSATETCPKNYFLYVPAAKAELGKLPKSP